jgi:hypothetical protein
MLLFASLPAYENYQPIWPGLTVFPDHLESHVAYYIPTSLELLPTQAGDPDFFLLSYHGDFSDVQGGLLHFRLGFAPLPEAYREEAHSMGWTSRAAAFERGRFRVRLRSLIEGEPDQLFSWHLMPSVGRELVSPSLSLDARETQCLKALLDDAENAVEVETDLSYMGLVPGIPWLVSASLPALRTQLAALLPEEPVDAGRVAVAFLSLPEGDASPFTYQALYPNAVQPSRDILLTEFAMRSLDMLFIKQPCEDEFAPALYRLRPAAAEDPPAITCDLLPLRLEMRSAAVSWDVGSFIRSIDTPVKRQKLFPTVTRVSPFAETEVHVISRVPCDSRFLRKVAVDIRYMGKNGVPEYRSYTLDDDNYLHKFSTYYPALMGDFRLAARFTTFLAPKDGNGWPVVYRGEYLDITGPVVEVTRENIKMDFVHIEAEPGVFTLAASVELSLYSSDPGISNPITPDSGTSESGISNPSTANSGTPDPGTSDPTMSDPGMSNPGMSDPGTSDPTMSDPGMSNPGMSDPGMFDPGTLGPDTSDSGTSNVDTSEHNTSCLDPAAVDSETPSQPLVQLLLNESSPSAWIALPGVESTAELYVIAKAQAADKPSGVLREVYAGRVNGRQVRIAEYQLRVLDPDQITVRLDPQAAGKFAFVQVLLASLTGSGRAFELKPDQLVTWNLFRNSIFEEMKYRYRLDYVPINDKGHTLPMVSTDWQESNLASLTILPP